MTQALTKLRSRVKPATKIIVMIPISGGARTQVTQACNTYNKSADDQNLYLVDLGKLTFPTCDGQHPTAEGHQAIYKVALKDFNAVVGR